MWMKMDRTNKKNEQIIIMVGDIPFSVTEWTVGRKSVEIKKK